MGDVLDISKVEFKIKGNMELICEFLAFRDPNHQMDAHARKVLEYLASNPGSNQLPEEFSSGVLGHASLEQLGYRPGIKLREAFVIDGLARIGAKRCSLALALHLWAAEKGTLPVGLVYTAPIPGGKGGAYYLVVREVQGIRWLYARRQEQQRLWDPETRVIFAL